MLSIKTDEDDAVHSNTSPKFAIPRNTFV